MMLTADDTLLQVALRTLAQGRIVRRWTEGHGIDRQDIVLVEGPWGLRLVDGWADRWAAYACAQPAEDVALVERLAAEGYLFNVGACFRLVEVA